MTVLLNSQALEELQRSPTFLVDFVGWTDVSYTVQHTNGGKCLGPFKPGVCNLWPRSHKGLFRPSRMALRNLAKKNQINVF